MSTISTIQSKLKEFNTFAKSGNASEADYIQKWNDLFDTPLSSQSSKSFATYYRDMRSNTRRSKQRGGASPAIQGAPLDYSMAPGLNIQTYGRFPIEAGTDPASIRNFDVYFKDSLTQDCGVKDSTLNVPADMGSNKVGGGKSRRRRDRGSKKSRRRSRNERKSRRRFRQRGGNILESITARAPFVYNATVSPSLIQQGSMAWAGQPGPAPADPSAHTWELRTSGTGGLINPGLVANVPNDVGRLANPTPWMSAN
jgi:hypothetical protein